MPSLWFIVPAHGRLELEENSPEGE